MLVVLIFIVQVSAGIAAYVMRSDVKDFLRDNLQESMQNYHEDNPHITKTWNVIQHDVRQGVWVQLGDANQLQPVYRYKNYADTL